MTRFSPTHVQSNFSEPRLSYHDVDVKAGEVHNNTYLAEFVTSYAGRVRILQVRRTPFLASFRHHELWNLYYDIDFLLDNADHLDVIT